MHCRCGSVASLSISGNGIAAAPEGGHALIALGPRHPADHDAVDVLERVQPGLAQKVVGVGERAAPRGLVLEQPALQGRVIAERGAVHGDRDLGDCGT